jgi:hypothetical protein
MAGVAIALAVSLGVGWLMARVTIYALGSEFRLSKGAFSPAALYIMTTAGLVALGYAKRLLIIPVVYIAFPVDPRGTIGIRWARSVVRGAIALNYRRRAYELGTFALMGTLLQDLGALRLPDFGPSIPSTVIVGALLTFLAVDTYLATFMPTILGDDDFDVRTVWRPEAEFRDQEEG